MLKGSGIHKEFGWKPVGKYHTAGVGSYSIDITNLIDNGEILIIHANFNPPNGMFLRVNADGGANYTYSKHTHGNTAGAVHAQADASAQTRFILNAFDRTSKCEMQLQGYNANLLLHAKLVGFLDATHYEAIDYMGWYNQDVPYTSLLFDDGMGANFTADFQLFRGVYSL